METEVLCQNKEREPVDRKEQKKAAAAFAAEWAGKVDEKQDTHRFRIGFLQKVLGVENTDEHIQFEKPVKYKGHTTYIDAYIPETRVLIEQKSSGLPWCILYIPAVINTG